MPQTLTKRGWDPTGFCLRGRRQPDVIRALWAKPRTPQLSDGRRRPFPDEPEQLSEAFALGAH